MVSLTSSESVDVVSENDETLYVTSLEDCKRNGLLHRCVSIFLLNSDGELLLQRRSLQDDWLPGKWTVSSTGHVRAGEIPWHASIRELKEELGIDAEPKFLFKLVLPRISWSEFTEYELAYAFEASTDMDIVIEPLEVQQVKFLPISDCRAIVQDHREDFTPDAVVLLKLYLDRAERQ